MPCPLVCDQLKLMLFPACTLVDPVMLPAHGVAAALTVIEWLSVAVPVLVQVTEIDTERLPCVTPVTVIVDDVLLPLNPVPTDQA